MSYEYEDKMTERFIVVGMDFVRQSMQTQRDIVMMYIDFCNKTIDRFDPVKQLHELFMFWARYDVMNEMGKAIKKEV